MSFIKTECHLMNLTYIFYSWKPQLWPKSDSFNSVSLGFVERISGVKDERELAINAAAWNAIIVKYLLSKPNDAPAVQGMKLIEQAEVSVCSSWDNGN